MDYNFLCLLGLYGSFSCKQQGELDLDMAKNVVREGKKYRSKILVICVLLVFLCIAFIGWLLPLGIEYLRRLDAETAIFVIEMILVLIFLSVIPFAFYLFMIGRRIVKHERFPPPGTKVIRNTVLIMGDKARLRGQVLVFLSVVLVLIGLIGAFTTHYALHRLAAG